MDAYDVYIAKLRQDQDALDRLKIRMKAIRGMSDPGWDFVVPESVLRSILTRIHEEAVEALEGA